MGTSVKQRSAQIPILKRRRAALCDTVVVGVVLVVAGPFVSWDDLATGDLIWVK